MGRRSITAKIFDNASTSRRFSKIGIFYHDIQPEDTMESLCARYNVSEEEILKANFGMRSTLSGGQKRIIIPLKETEEHSRKLKSMDAPFPALSFGMGF